MFKAKQKRRTGFLDLPMTSMIDVVFLMLIFFLSSSQFMSTERNLSPTIGFRQMRSHSEAMELEPLIIEVQSSAAGPEYRLGGRRLGDAGALADVLKQLPIRDTGVVVRVRDGARFGDAAAAIQACESAGFSPVSYVPADDANFSNTQP